MEAMNSRDGWLGSFLAIDIGSTSSRIHIYCPGLPPHDFSVANANVPRHVYLEKGDFSSVGYPFDGDQQPYMREEVPNSDAIRTSLKPGFILGAALTADEKDDLLCEYPNADQINAIRRAFPNDRMERRFTQGIKQLLLTLREAAEVVCKYYSLHILAIGVAIPGHWHEEIQDFYHSLVYDAFKGFPHSVITRNCIHFHYETQALAHYIFNTRLNAIPPPKSSQCELIVMDFGGQNLVGRTPSSEDETLIMSVQNVSVYHIAYDKGRPAALYEVDKSLGVAGGSEQHGALIGEYCAEYTRKTSQTELATEQRQGYVLDFNNKKAHLDEHHDGSLNTLSLYWEREYIPLSPAVVKAAFDRALKKPLECAAEVLNRAWSEDDPEAPQDVHVIIAGGSARYRPLRAQMRELCRERNMNPPIFEHELSIAEQFGSQAIARGAAYATNKIMTVQEFMNRGPAFGIQMLQGFDEDTGEPNDTWDNTAKIIYSAHASRRQEFQVVKGDRLRIICKTINSDSKLTNIHHRDAYNIYDLGLFNEGDATFTLTTNGGKDDMRLRLTMEWEAPDMDPVRGSLVLPLRFDRSSGCVIVKIAEVQDSLPEMAFSKPRPARVRAAPERADRRDPPTPNLSQTLISPHTRVVKRLSKKVVAGSSRSKPASKLIPAKRRAPAKRSKEPASAARPKRQRSARWREINPKGLT